MDVDAEQLICMPPPSNWWMFRQSFLVLALALAEDAEVETEADVDVDEGISDEGVDAGVGRGTGSRRCFFGSTLSLLYVIYRPLQYI